MNIKEFVSKFNLKEGDTHRTNCPECLGKKTFSISKKNGVILYNCFKASCRLSGRVSGNMSSKEVKDRMCLNLESKFLGKYSPDFPLPKQFVSPDHDVNKTVSLDTAIQLAECSKYILKYRLQKAIKSKYCKLVYDLKESRVVFILYDNSSIVGAVGRSLDGSLPKWKRYDKNKDVLFMCGEKKGIAVLVEDCVSAVSCFNAGFTGVALLGTNLNQGHIFKLHVFDRVVVCLDPDASKKAIKMKKLLDTYIKCNVKFIPDDLKYLSPKTVRSLVDVCS